MRKSIKDIFDSYLDETVDIKTADKISPEKIIELTKNKIAEENEIMNMTKSKKKWMLSLIAAALTAALSCTAFAAYCFLSPKEIAKEFEDDKLAEYFEDNDIKFDIEPQISGDYKFELLGIASGKGLSRFADAKEDRSYIVGMVTKADGTELSDYPGVMVTPLVAGYKPWEVNAFTLGAGRSEFISDDRMADYFIFECDNIEIFADHTIYMAMYEAQEGDSIAPSRETFNILDDGTIQFAEGFKGAHALFEVPIDKSKADPEAVKSILNGDGLADDADKEAEQERENDFEITTSESASGDVKVIEIK